MNIALARALRQGIQLKDPRLYDLLGMVIDSIAKTDTDLAGMEASILASLGIAVAEELVAVEVFTYTILSRFVKLSWTPVSGAAQYEIRKGTNWDTANFTVRTPTYEALLDPMLIGSYTYLIKPMNVSGEYGPTAKSVVVTIPAIGGVTISPTVIDNNILLYWTTATSAFDLAYYRVEKNGSLVGNINGTFTTLFELQSGSYDYSITPYDIVGNAGTEATVTVAVNQPPDFVLKSDTYSTFTGTKTNCGIDGNGLLACINSTETYQEHFTSHSWSSPQDQVDAGYTLMIEPAQTTASYVETFDLGSIISNVMITIDWSWLVLLGSALTIDCAIETSTNGSTWDTAVHAKSTFKASVRYIRITLSFSGTNSLMKIYSLHCVVDVKLAVDSGNITANSGDSGGTVVNFNLAFIDVDSITVTSKSTDPIYPIYDFTDVENPTHFHVLVFDSSGNRITREVSWKARGIV